MGSFFKFVRVRLLNPLIGCVYIVVGKEEGRVCGITSRCGIIFKFKKKEKNLWGLVVRLNYLLVASAAPSVKDTWTQHTIELAYETWSLDQAFAACPCPNLRRDGRQWIGTHICRAACWSDKYVLNSTLSFKSGVAHKLTFPYIVNAQLLAGSLWAWCLPSRDLEFRQPKSRLGDMVHHLKKDVCFEGSD